MAEDLADGVPADGEPTLLPERVAEPRPEPVAARRQLILRPEPVVARRQLISRPVPGRHPTPRPA